MTMQRLGRSLRHLSCVAGGIVVLSVAPAARAADPAQSVAANKTDVAADQFQRRLEQEQINSRVLVNPEVPAEQRALVDYGAYLTFNYLSVDDPNQNTHILKETDLVGYGRVNLDNAQEFFVRGRASYFDFSTNDSFNGEGSRQHSVLEQMFYRFDLQRYLAAYNGMSIPNDLSIQAGRQTVIWGNGLTFNQDIDGAVFDATSGPLTLEAIGGLNTRETIDFDTSRPDFNRRTQRAFFGAILSLQVDRHRPYIYYLDQRDHNPDQTTVLNTPAGVISTRFDYNSQYLGGGSNGSLNDRLVYGVEGTVETGNGLSNSFTRSNGSVTPTAQRRDGIRAFAGDGRLDYVFPDPHNTRASAEIIFASGDHDRGTTNNTFNGNRPGTEDFAYNGFGLVNTGLAFAPEVSNVLIYRVGASTQPLNGFALFRKLETGADFFVFTKYLERAPIDEPTGSGRYLGWEPDIFLNWQATSDLTFALRYGIFFPGDKIQSSQRNRQLFFAGVTLAF